MDITAPQATVIAAVIAFIGGVIATYFAYVIPRRREGTALIAKMLQELVLVLKEMILVFRMNEVPTGAGHRLKVILEMTPRDRLTPELQNIFNELDFLKIAADQNDVDLRRMVENRVGTLANWIATAEHRISELEAYIILLGGSVSANSKTA